MARVIHFEIHAEDTERARRFYQDVFGWKFTGIRELDYWTIETGDGPGINGGMLQRRGPAPQPGQAVNAHVCTIGVDDLDAIVGRAEKAGASIALPRMTVPGVGYIAYLVDTEGNIFGVHQADANAGR
jgi:predicted enzyme related to lactoylglutathione lyase